MSLMYSDQAAFASLGGIQPSDALYVANGPEGPNGRYLCSRCKKECESHPPRLLVWAEGNTKDVWAFCSRCVDAASAVTITHPALIALDSMVRVHCVDQARDPLVARTDGASNVYREAFTELVRGGLAQWLDHEQTSIQLRPREWDPNEARWGFGHYPQEVAA